MTAEVYAKFLRRLGHTVTQTGPTFWFDLSFRVWQAFPFHRPVDPLAGGIRDLLVRRRFMAARFPVSVDVPGYDTGRLVCDIKDYDLSSLTKKARNQTRRGLESFEIREVSPVDLSEAGVEAYMETLSRQQRIKPRRLIDRWKAFCREAAQTPGFSAWGAYGKERLAAYLVSFQIEDCCNILIFRSSTGDLPKYPNNAVVFKATQSLLRRADVREVSFGWESLRQDLQGLSHFKEGMGFRRVPMQQCIILHPVLRPFLRFGLIDSLVTLARRFVDDDTYCKLRGFSQVARFSVECKVR